MPESSSSIPCPFLRALEAGSYIQADRESLQHLAEVIGAAAGGGQANELRVQKLVKLIAGIANGLAPWTLLKTLRNGLDLQKLRGGPLDKKSVNSQILRADGSFDPFQFARLKQFARPFSIPGGEELGLGLADLERMMDENFARAPQKRAIDRKLMNGEWPVLLKIMKKGEGDQAYLSLNELEMLFAQRKFPVRIEERLRKFRKV